MHFGIVCLIDIRKLWPASRLSAANHVQTPHAAFSTAGSCLMSHSCVSFRVSNTGLSYSSVHLIHSRHQSARGKPSLINQPNHKPSLIHASTCRMAGFPSWISQNQADLFNSPFKGLLMGQDRRWEVLTKRKFLGNSGATGFPEDRSGRS